METSSDAAATPSGSRMYQVDALRIFSMFLVCLLHAGGIFEGLSMAENPVDEILVVILVSFADVAVNCFMMITGYVSWGKEWKLRRYVNLWAQVAFYTIGLAILTSCIHMAIHGETGMTWSQLRSLFMPVPFASAYWYFTGYTVVFLMAPAMALLQKHSSQRQMLVIILVSFVMISIFASMFTGLKWGFSSMWLCTMYMAGSYLRQYPIRISNRRCWLCVLAGTCMTAFGLCFSVWLRKHEMPILYDSFNYASAILTIQSIMIVVLFTRMRIKSPGVCKIIGILNPLAFGVYLVHLHPCVRPCFHDAAVYFHSMFEYKFISVILVAVAIYIVCSLIDGGRLLLFRLMHVRDWCDKAGNRITACLGTVLSWLLGDHGGTGNASRPHGSS